MLVSCRTPEEFSKKLEFAMAHEPHAMQAGERKRLTWDAATERFLDVAELKGEEKATPVSAAIDTLVFNLHNYLTGATAAPLLSLCIWPLCYFGLLQTAVLWTRYQGCWQRWKSDTRNMCIEL